MDIYLLPRRGREHFLYGSEPDDAPAETVASDASAARKMLELGRKGYRSLTQSRRKKEALLKSLGGVQRVRIHYPASLTEAGARRVYNDLLAQETAKHKKWLAVNATALPLAVPLSLVPGPNIVLAYLAWRTVTHYQSKKAGEKAAELHIDFVPEEALDELTNVIEKRLPFSRKKRIRKLGLKLGLDQLGRAY